MIDGAALTPDGKQLVTSEYSRAAAVGPGDRQAGAPMEASTFRARRRAGWPHAGDERTRR
jgi:hypothetical protein